MESIPLEQLALTCKTLHDARILELHRAKEQMKPQCLYNTENDTFEIVHPYGKSMFYASSAGYVQQFRELLEAIREGGNYLMDKPGFIIEVRDFVYDGQAQLISSSDSVASIEPQLLIPALEALVAHCS
jgi:hypothetical protein